MEGRAPPPTEQGVGRGPLSAKSAEWAIHQQQGACAQNANAENGGLKAGWECPRQPHSGSRGACSAPRLSSATVPQASQPTATTLLCIINQTQERSSWTWEGGRGGISPACFLFLPSGPRSWSHWTFSPRQPQHGGRQTHNGVKCCLASQGHQDGTEGSGRCYTGSLWESDSGGVGPPSEVASGAGGAPRPPPHCTEAAPLACAPHVDGPKGNDFFKRVLQVKKCM